MPYDIDAPLVPHNEPLDDDTIFDLRLNHVWRRIVGGILFHAMEYIVWTGSPAEIEQAKNWFADLVTDFYDETIGGEMAYMGALVGRTTGFTANATPTYYGLDDDATFPLHDIGGFWSAGNPGKLIVPVGGAGYYHCHAAALAGGDPRPLNLTLDKNGGTALAAYLTPEEKVVTLQVATIAYFDDGDFLQAEISCNSGDHVFLVNATTGHSLTLQMHRIGIAP